MDSIDTDVWGRPVYAPAPRHTCPDWHNHGGKLCLDRHQCSCDTCQEARDVRTVERRRKDLQRPAERPVAVRWTAHTKSAPSGPVRRPERVQSYKSDATPKELPEGVQHGHKSYLNYACRCDPCKKGHASYQAKFRQAKKLGLSVAELENRPPVHTDQPPVPLPDGKSHGTRWAYKTAKCKCTECRRFIADWRQDVKRRRAEES